MAKYTIIAEEGRAKRASFETVHGTVETPVFMNVATAAAIKGGVGAYELKEIGTQIALCNTYHLHVRPGDGIVRKMGGLPHFMDWDRPILTDSGGFQVFSLAKLRHIKEEGVTFQSHVDGRRIFMGPEESMRIQSNLGSTIAMAFDECPSSTLDEKYIRDSVARTERWLVRCAEEMKRLNSLEDTVNREQLLFGINQGAVSEEIRIENAEKIREMDLPGYAVGGLRSGRRMRKCTGSLTSRCRIFRAINPFISWASARRPIYSRRWRGASISLTVFIRPGTGDTATCTPITVRSIS